MGSFRELREHDLQTLSDDRLIAYMREARAAARFDALKLALAVLVHGYWSTVLKRCSMKVNENDVEDVAARALDSAIASAFDGSSTGEFVSWLHTIVDRRIADYHRSKEGKPLNVPLPTEHLEDEEVWGHEPAESFQGDAIDAQRALETAYCELRAEHSQVIDLYVLGPYGAAEAAGRIDGMTEDNVHQIASRFQRRFRELLESGDTRDEP